MHFQTASTLLSRAVGRAFSSSSVTASAAAAAEAAPRTALVQGASRGLGLEFTRQLLQRPNTQVVATCRDPAAATQLHALQQSAGADRLALVQLDCTSEEGIDRAAAEVAGMHPCLDLLVNAAGVLHVPGVMSPETAVARMTLDNLIRCHQVNAFGPILVSKAFLPLLVKAQEVHGASDERPAVIASISARVGSIGDNKTGGWYSYRASKTSLNALSKTLSLELARRRHKVATILLHPGTVDTDLSKPFQKNVPAGKLFTREFSIQQLLAIIDRTTMENNGGYYDWQGETIEW